MQVVQPAGNHNGGNIAFGPDGFLWLGLGDGGGSGDQFNNAQNTNTLLGSMLRIDLGPTGVTYAQPRLMRRIADIAKSNGLGLHTHFHPRQIERDICLRETGMDTVGFLRDSGWLTPRAWYAHCAELSDEEMAAFFEDATGLQQEMHGVVNHVFDDFAGEDDVEVTVLVREGVALGVEVIDVAGEVAEDFVVDAAGGAEVCSAHFVVTAQLL